MRRIQLSDSGPVFLPPSPLARPSKFGTSHWLPPTTPVVDWRRTGSTCKSGLGATASSISAAFPYPNRIFAFHAVASCCLSGSSLPARPSSSFSGRKEWNFLILCDRSVGRFAVYFMRAFSPSVPMHRIFSFGMLRSDLVKAFSMALYTSLCRLRLLQPQSWSYGNDERNIGVCTQLGHTHSALRAISRGCGRGEGGCTICADVVGAGRLKNVDLGRCRAWKKLACGGISGLKVRRQCASLLFISFYWHLGISLDVEQKHGESWKCILHPPKRSPGMRRDWSRNRLGVDA
ncbi:hypothetical protein V9T40_007760 [Parthenolecanium corni]|uniref:Uncharacterized protein n=1 Tax=Parthenolecanium corni TaxID=536013 RepID=A0AAN9TI83_9HEMI